MALISGPLTYYTFSADISVPKFGGGFGLILNKSSEGTAYLTKTNVSGLYSYSVEFGETGTLSFGIQAGVTNRKIDYDKLVFYDQLSDQGIISGGVSAASPPEFNNKYFFDSGAGLNLIVGNFMTGPSIHHLNKPNESFTGSSSILPMRLNGYMSFRLPLEAYANEDSPAIIPSIVYYQHAGRQSISGGFQIKRKSVNAGLWYRSNGKEKDAIAFSLIFDLFMKKDYYDKVRLGLSHDFTTSKLGYGNTAGTTEGAVIYETTIFDNSGYNSSTYKSNYGRRCYDFY